MSEEVVTFGSASALIGIRTHPAHARRRTALVLVNSGVVNRVGANRMTVTLARALAEEGYQSLRFDMSGLGDSPERADGLAWTASSVLEIAEAIDLLGGGCRPVVLYGNCGGAAKAFWTSLADTRVAGLLFTNPPPHPAEDGLPDAALDAGARLAAQIAGIVDRGTPTAFLYAENDPGLSYFDRRLRLPLLAQLNAEDLQVFVVGRSNHTFATGESRRTAIGHMLEWLRRTFPDPES